MKLRGGVAVLVLVAATIVGYATRAGAAQPGPLKILVLGDSYASGTAAGNYYGPKDCQRSHSGWAELYAAGLRAGGRQVTVTNRACSGATTAAFAAPTQLTSTYHLGACPVDSPDETAVHTSAVRCANSVAPQMASVDSSVDLVLFTLGGDDVGFTGIVTGCIVPVISSPAKCRQQIASAQSRLPAVQAALTRILTELRAKLRPDAKVVLLGYPQLIGAGPFLLIARDLLGKTTDSYDAAAAIRQLGTAGAGTQAAAVASANATARVTFASYLDTVQAAFAGHEPDPRPLHSNPQRWLEQLFDSLDSDEWYHPNSAGQQAYARLLTARGL